MRRAQNLRVSSTRDVCIFCATRQLATRDARHSALTLTQRRSLNSSSRGTQYAAEAQLFKEEGSSPRPMTEAERMRQRLLAAHNPSYNGAQPSQGVFMSQAEQARAHLLSQAPKSPLVQQQPQDRRTPNRSNPFEGLGRNQHEDRFAPRRMNGFNNRNNEPRYNVRMNAKPPVGDAAFGPGHLRRRNEPQNNQHQQMNRKAPMQPRRQLDQSELDRLLQGNSKREAYRPSTFPRTANATRKCFHCGKEGHMSHACPEKAVLREPTHQPQDPRKSGKEASLANGVESWLQKKGNRFDEDATSGQVLYEKEPPRRATGAPERRRSRFEKDDEPMETKNRYEEPATRKKGGQDRRARGRVMRDEEEEDDYDRHVSKAERKRQRKEAKKAALAAKAPPTPVFIPEYISVINLSTLLKVRAEEFVDKLYELGFEEVQMDHILNAEHAALVAQEYNFDPVVQNAGIDGDLTPAPALSPEEYAALPARPPVVTIMGHVDHGKTTILDYMRSTSVAATEFGGITQHIGAFSVPLASGKKITFLDTPGHAAFETMRARGANVTDIVVLVVAADDSVMPQTVEAIKHAQAAKVPIIVAINKIDKQQADPEHVKADLGRHGIEVEDFGGEVQAICVSGKTGQGIPELEEAITTLSEMLDHRADPKAKVEGWVLEGTTKKSGRVATVLVRSGTLRTGDLLVAGKTWTRVRSLRNEAGVMVKEVGPGLPVEVDGWREQPIAGDEVLQAADEQQAANVAERRLENLERVQMAKDMEAINESRRLEEERRKAEEAAENGEVVEAAEKETGPEIVPFIVKGDVSGSVEAVIDSVSAIGNAEVGTRILRHGVGSPSEFDVQHAADARGHIVNFNTTIPPQIASLAEEKGVKILDSNIIYRVVENVKALLSEKLSPNVIQKVTGEAEIAAVFDISLGGKKTLKVAGSKVRNGIVERGTKARVLRGDNTIFTGTVSSLKNQKKDAESMRKDTECGIAFDGWAEFQPGDKIQCFQESFEKRSL